MAEFKRIPIQGAIPEQAFHVKDGQTDWLFLTPGVPVGPWLVIHRQSSTDFDFESILGRRLTSGPYATSSRMGGTVACAIASAMGREFNGRYSHVSARHYADSQVKNSGLRAFKLELPVRERFIHGGSYYLSEHRVKVSRSNDEETLRAQLAEELGSILAARWMLIDNHMATWKGLSWYEKAEQIKAIYAEGFTQAYLNLVADLKLIGGLWMSAFGDNDMPELRFSRERLAARFDNLQALLGEVYGLNYESVEDLCNAVVSGAAIVQLFYSDPECRELLMSFLDGLSETVLFTDTVYQAGVASGELSIDVLLSLASRGSGMRARKVVQAAADMARPEHSINDAKSTQMVGPFNQRSIALIHRIVQSIKERSAAIQRKADDEKAREEAAKKASEAHSPSQIAKMRRKGKDPDKKDDGDGNKLTRGPKVRVKCFCVDDHAPGGRDEYQRQLDNQQEGINSMTADEYLDSRRHFTGKDPCCNYKPTGLGKNDKRDSKKAKEARKDYRETLEEQYTEDFEALGMDPEDSKRLGKVKARQEMGRQDALHNQDRVAGGKDEFGLPQEDGSRTYSERDFGEKKTNRHIGSQWNGGRVESMDQQACEQIKNGQGQQKMNVELRPCGKKEAEAAGCRKKGKKRKRTKKATKPKATP